jgi:hypothetical protein
LITTAYNFSDLDRMLPSSGNPLILPKTLPQVAAPTILQSAGNPLEATQTVRSGKDYWFALAGTGGSSNSGNISTLFGYDQYQILSSTFTDDSITFQFANNYVEQSFLSDGSNYSRLTSGTDGLTLESYYLQTSPFATGPRDVTLQTFDTTTGVVLSAGIDVATSSFLVSTTNGIISETGTISSLNLTVLDLDGQILTATPTDLLLNGSTIAVAQNISSLNEWAYDPAISSIQANNNDLVDVRAGYFSSITANGIQTNTLTAISTIESFNYLSTALVNADIVSAASVVASTFNGYTVSDFLSTSPSQYDPNPLFSTIVVYQYISTPDLEVSSINGHEINQNTVIISTVNTDQLNAIQISSVVGDVKLQLVSTLSLFGSLGSNSFSLGGIDLGLADVFGQLTGGGLGTMSLITSGVALGTSVAALNQTRPTNNINTANYEMVNGTTQLQVSTVGEFVSSVYRFSSGVPADQQVGAEYFTSTIYAPGTTLLRSMGDPLNTISTPLSTIQAFGQWVALPEAPAVSTVSTFVDLTTESLFASSIQLGPSTILTAESDFPGLSVRQADDLSIAQINVSALAIGDPNLTFEGAYTYAPNFDRATVINSTLQTKFIAYLDDLQNIQNNSVSTFQLNVSSINSQPYQPFSGGQYYKTSNQNLPSGQNFIIFDASKPWTSADFVQTDPSTFVCSTTGTYQVGLNATIFAGTGTWTALNKGLLIQQDRGGAENVIVNTTSVPSTSNYGQSASALLDIQQGDNLRFITGQVLTTGSTICLGLSNTFDYNTFWDYQLLRKD